MKYVYPAVFSEEDGKICISVPDLPGTHTFGNDWAEALEMAKDAVEMWLWDAENNGEHIPPASKPDDVIKNHSDSKAIISLIAADTDSYRKQNDTRAVKKTLSIPAWLNHQAEKANAPFSQILQEGLKEYLHLN